MADITARLKLDGEAQFKRGMKDAATATKSLDSQLQLAEKQFKETGDAEEYMKQKGELLDQKLNSQKSAVDTAKRALEQLKKQGYEDTSTEVLKWKGQLANAESQVIDITREIENNKKGLDKAGRSYEDVAKDAKKMGGQMDDAQGDTKDLNDELRQIGVGVSWDNVTSGLASINSAIDNGIKKVAQWGKQLWNMAVDATVWADDLNTMSQRTGIDTDSLQQWSYASRFIDTDVNAIIQARRRLSKSMMTGDFEATLNGYGVATRDANGQLRDATDIMWDVLGVMSRIDNATERDALAMSIFGRGADELMPMMIAGREEWERVCEEAPIVPKEDLDSMQQANDSIEEMNAKLENMERTLLAKLAPVITVIADAISGAVDKLNEYLETDEGKDLLQRMSDAAVNIAENLLDIDWGTALDGAVKAFTAIVNGLEWIVDHKDVVLAALAALAGAKIFTTLAVAASNVMKIGQGIGNLIGKGGTGAGAGTGATGGGGGVATGVGTGATAAKTGFWAKLGMGATAAGNSVSSALGLSTTGAAALAVPALGSALGILGVLGVAGIGKSQQIEIQIVGDENRYADREDKDIIQTAVRTMMGQGADESMWSMNWLAANVGSGNLFSMFDYEDAERGRQNWLVDKLGSEDTQTSAAIYAWWSHNFGDINSARGRAAFDALSPEQQSALLLGQHSYMTVKDSGAVLDYSWLLGGMKNFWWNSGSMDENGLWTIPGLDEGLVLTRPENVAAGGEEATSPSDIAAIMAGALSGVAVEIDGREAGRLIAPTVVDILARINMSRGE